MNQNVIIFYDSRLSIYLPLKKIQSGLFNTKKFMKILKILLIAVKHVANTLETIIMKNA